MKYFAKNRHQLGKRGLAIVAATLSGLVGSANLAFSQSLPAPVAPATPDNPAETPTELDLPSLANAWRTPQFLRTLEGHQAPVDALTFTPDSKILLSGGSRNDGQIKLWWMNSGTQIDSLRAHRTSIVALTFTPDGKTLASGGGDAGVNLWNWNPETYEGEYHRTFLDHDSNLLALAITPDSQTLVTGGLDGIRLWDLRTQRPLYTLARFDNQTYALAVNPMEGEILASGMKDGTIKLWNLSSGRLLSTLPAHSRPTSALAFTPDGQTLVSGSYDQTVKVWNLRTGQLAHTLSGHTGRIQAIAINPDGTTLASASRDGVRLWNLRTGEQLALLQGHEDWVESVAFSYDGRVLASGGFDRTIRLWQVSSTVSAAERE
jgi:WD40 repeat protein